MKLKRKQETNNLIYKLNNKINLILLKKIFNKNLPNLYLYM